MKDFAGKTAFVTGGAGGIGRRVLDAMAAGEFFIFTHEEPRAWIETRHTRLMDGFDSVERYNAKERGS
jgi:NAD(P)-dependent dehydrogenase (short-subunit alcohol dehydrogenase family)